jgi:serine/threonine-protein kinase
MAELTQLGRYKLVRVLGRGAMGVVYEGLDPALNRRVAIKTILRNAAIDHETAQAYSAQFTREAQAAGRLNHPNIVQVHDFALEGDVAYLVMEYIQGRELRSYFEAKEKFTIEESVRIMGELLDALDLAHDAGVIHRDIKPANVMLDAQRRVKLADFGVARIQDSERSAAGTMVGTPAFMSPEQIQGAKIDRRTDIFSAGVVLYQLLTGEQPFTGAGAWTVAKKIMQDDPPPPSGVVKSISPVFDGIVNRALAKNPADRFPNAREFATALRAAGGPAAMPASSTLPPGQPAMARPSAKASEAEIEFWRAIQNSSDAAEFEFYLEQFPEGTYASLARHKIAKLKDPGDARKAAEELARQEAEAREAQLRESERQRAEAEEQARIKAEAEAFAKAQAEEARVRRDAEERRRKEAETRARVEAEVKAQREAAEKAKREAAEKAKRAAEEKARQAAALAKLQAQEAAAPKVDPDATVAISRSAPAAAGAPPPEKKSFVLPAVIGAVVVIGGVAAFLLLNRKPAEAPVAVAPPPVAAPAKPAAPAVDEDKIRREIEEKLRREFADKSAAEQAAAKAAAEKAITEKIAAEKALAAKAEKAAADKAAAEKLAAEKMAAAKSAGERAALEKAAAEKAAAEKAAADKLAAEKAAADKAAAEKAATEKLASERSAVEKAAAAKAATPVKPGFPMAGDRWVYEVRPTNFPDKRYELRVEASTVSESFVNESATSATGIYNARSRGAEMNLEGMAPGLAVFAPYLHLFRDLRAGEKLNVGSITLWGCANNASCSASTKVIGKERVTVKAGAFDAWKVVMDVNFAFGGGSGGTRGVEMTFWYAEGAKRLVKYQMRQLTGMTWNHPDTTMELVSYTPAGGR